MIDLESQKVKNDADKKRLQEENNKWHIKEKELYEKNTMLLNKLSNDNRTQKEDYERKILKQKEDQERYNRQIRDDLNKQKQAAKEMEEKLKREMEAQQEKHKSELEKLKQEREALAASKQTEINLLKTELDREQALTPPPNHGKDEESNQNKKGKKKTSIPD